MWLSHWLLCVISNSARLSLILFIWCWITGITLQIFVLKDYTTQKARQVFPFGEES